MDGNLLFIVRKVEVDKPVWNSLVR